MDTSRAGVSFGGRVQGELVVSGSASGATRHKLVTASLYYVAGSMTLFLVVMAVAVPASLLSGAWAWVGGFAGFAVATSLALAGWRRLRRWRSDGFYRLHFPDYTGAQFYAGSLLAAEGAAGAVRVEDKHHKVADGGETLFILGLGKNDTPHEAIGGALVRVPGGAPLAIPRADVLTVRVHEFDDAAIKAATESTDEEWAERAISQGLMWAIGRSVSHTIVPYAAYVELLYRQDGDLGRVLWAVRTDVPAGALQALGVDDVSDTDPLVAAAAAKSIDKAQEAALDYAHEKATDVLGSGVVGAADTAASLYGDISAVANLGSAKIGPTDGARGRLYARLVAEKLRQMAGLESFDVMRTPA